MMWNWQKPDWPNLIWDPEPLAPLEAEFLKRAGRLSGIWQHLTEDDGVNARVILLTDEAMRSSAIEGEMLDRSSVQSSVRRAFGLQAERSSRPAEAGIAALVADMHQNWKSALTAEMLFDWHRLICAGRNDLTDLGRWRGQGDPMQVISGPYQKPKVHFEAPPVGDVSEMMQAFICWFNDTDLPPLSRAALAHLWFVCVHPFEDGNGRIGRALSDKALAQGFGGANLAALSTRIESTRRAYYDALERNNKSLEVQGWMEWFAQTVLEAQDWSERVVLMLLEKARLFDRLRGQLNDRQERVLLRMFDAGPEGFVGGLSAHNYITLTAASPATARRDLGELVSLDALTRTGERKGTRYWLKVAGQGPKPS